MLTKTEWLSLRLHSETIFNLVSKLNCEEGVYSEQQLVLELESELTSMKTMTSIIRAVATCHPVDLINREGAS